MKKKTKDILVYSAVTITFNDFLCIYSEENGIHKWSFI